MIEAVSVDFDGVIHNADKGWQGGTVYGDPMPGALQALRELMDKHPVFIMTARPDLEPVAQWLSRLGFETMTQDAADENAKKRWHTRGILLVTNAKLPAIAYIDDKGFGFEGWHEDVVDWVNRTAEISQGGGVAHRRRKADLEANIQGVKMAESIVRQFGDLAYSDRGHKAAEVVWAAADTLKQYIETLRSGLT